MCAGEGTRIKEYAEETPKPLIRVKNEENQTILEIILHNLFQHGIERIVIVTGHLRKNIDDFINNFKNYNEFSSKDVTTLYSGRYKVGPLFSLLTITVDESIFTHNKLFMVFPGDTIFELGLLSEIINSIETTLNETPNPVNIFYREINVGVLKQRYHQSRTISIAQINKSGSREILNQIIQTELNKLSEEEVIKQVIPVFLLNYDYIKKISQYQILDSIHTIRGIMNYSIADGAIIYANHIPNDFEFYDIDYLSDLEYYEELRKNEQ